MIALAAGVAGRTAAQQKIAQKLVQYQDKPKDGLTCDRCLHWMGPDGCKLVEGKINAKGWCAIYVAQAPKK